MKTKYDDQIAHLTTHPDRIMSDWTCCEGLFDFIGGIFAVGAGCPTSIRQHYGMEPPFPCRAYINGEYNEALTKRIAEDESIPKRAEDITPEHLPAFLVLRLEIDSLEEEAQKQTT